MNLRIHLRAWFILPAIVMLIFPIGILLADGLVIKPRNYKGSLEEKAQEAIIIFQGGSTRGEAVEDLILKIHVDGEAENFAWVVPLPNEPTIKKESPELFKDVFDYVQARTSRTKSAERSGGVEAKNEADSEKVKVLSRQVVGSFDVAVVKETAEGGLNPWLEKEGFQTLQNADDVLGFYRKKNYVFACMKVSSEALAEKKKIESHPLRFTFKTGGQDGIYFPMKLTGLQTAAFDVNLYVFYRYWLNDSLNQFGYRNRGMNLVFRDYDSETCEANGGKNYSLPSDDNYLIRYASKLTSVTKLFQKLHPGKKFYLTNIQARNLKPEDVREWSDDLWLFPHYTDRSVVPYDVRDQGPASAAWPDSSKARTDSDQLEGAETDDGGQASGSSSRPSWLYAAMAGLVAVAILAMRFGKCCGTSGRGHSETNLWDTDNRPSGKPPLG